MTIKKEINYRNNGAIGALLDEYERAINCSYFTPSATN